MSILIPGMEMPVCCRVCKLCGYCVEPTFYADKNNHTFCTLFNSFVYIHRGQFLKCRECYTCLYDALEQEG